MKRAILIYAAVDGFYHWQVKGRVRRSLGIGPDPRDIGCLSNAELDELASHATVYISRDGRGRVVGAR